MRSDVTPFGVLSSHHRAFRAYHRALVVGALGELVQHDEVAGCAVRAWRPGVDAPEVARALDALYRGETHVLELVTRGTPNPGPVAAPDAGWEFEAGALLASPGCVAAWWYREEGEATGAGARSARSEEWVVLGLFGHAGLWRVGSRSTPSSAGVSSVLLEGAAAWR